MSRDNVKGRGMTPGLYAFLLRRRVTFPCYVSVLRLLVKQHEPARYVNLRGRGTANACLLTGPLEDELQGLGPLVVDTQRVGRPLRFHGVHELYTTEATAGTQRRFGADFVRRLHVAAVGLAERVASDDFIPREHQRRTDPSAVVAVHHERQVRET